MHCVELGRGCTGAGLEFGLWGGRTEGAVIQWANNPVGYGLRSGTRCGRRRSRRRLSAQTLWDSKRCSPPGEYVRLSGFSYLSSLTRNFKNLKNQKIIKIIISKTKKLHHSNGPGWKLSLCSWVDWQISRGQVDSKILMSIIFFFIILAINFVHLIQIFEHFTKSFISHKYLLTSKFAQFVIIYHLCIIIMNKNKWIKLTRKESWIFVDKKVC